MNCETPLVSRVSFLVPALTAKEILKKFYLHNFRFSYVANGDNQLSEATLTPLLSEVISKNKIIHAIKKNFS